MKKRLFLSLAVFLFIFYSYITLTGDKKQAVRITGNINNPGQTTDFNFKLEPQSYFVKIKFLNKNSCKVKLSFNNIDFHPWFKQSKADILTITGHIRKEMIGNDNILKIYFEDNIIPPDLDVTLTNYRKVISNDIYIYYKSYLPKNSFKFNEFIILTVIFLSLFVYSRLAVLFLKPNSVFKYEVLPILPFLIFITILHMVPIFSPYRVLLDGLYFIFIGAISFFVICTGFVIRHSFKTIAYGCILYLILFFVLFGIGEILTRIYIANHYKNNPFISEDADLGCGFLPNYNGQLNGVAVKINSLGIRNKEIDLSKLDRPYRILCLGDSITFGFGIEEDKIYVRQLQNLLNKKAAEPVYQTINCGILSYNANQERLFLERKALKFNPNLVIIQVCLNDLNGGINIPSIVNTLLSFDEYSFEQMSFMNKTKYLFARKSYFFQYLMLKFRAICRKYNLYQQEQAGEYGKKELDLCSGKDIGKEWIIFQGEIIKIKELLKNRNIKLLMVVFPIKIQLERNDLRLPQKMIKDFCRDNDILCLDLMETYAMHKNQDMYIDTGHPSDYGHQVTALEIYKYLANSNLLVDKF